MGIQVVEDGNLGPGQKVEELMAELDGIKIVRVDVNSKKRDWHIEDDINEALGDFIRKYRGYRSNIKRAEASREAPSTRQILYGSGERSPPGTFSKGSILSEEATFKFGADTLRLGNEISPRSERVAFIRKRWDMLKERIHPSLRKDFQVYMQGLITYDCFRDGMPPEIEQKFR